MDTPVVSTGGASVATGAVGLGRSSWAASAEGCLEPFRLTLLMRPLTTLSCLAFSGEEVFDGEPATAQNDTKLKKSKENSRYSRTPAHPFL